MNRIQFQLFDLEPMMSGNLPKQLANSFAHLSLHNPFTVLRRPNQMVWLASPIAMPHVTGPVLLEAARRFHPRPAGRGIQRRFSVMSLRVQGDLHRFKEFIEKRGRETEAWPGQI